MGQFFFTLKLPFDMMIFCFNVFSVVFFFPRGQSWTIFVSVFILLGINSDHPPVRRQSNVAIENPLYSIAMFDGRISLYIYIYIPLCLAISHAIPIKSLKNPSFHYCRVPYFPKAMESQCRYLNYPLVN